MSTAALTTALAIALTSAIAPTVALADHIDSAPVRADSHAPIGVMADHYHGRGEWMLSYRYMRMDMEDNQSGGRDIDPATIATSISNRFFGIPGQPPTLRVVPLSMSMDMHMFGLMYGINDALTLAVMTNYIDKSMDHVTFQGGMGSTELGRFRTQSSGLGDSSVSLLWRLQQNEHGRLHATIGLSLPTGSVDETDSVLTPMNMRPSLRLPYPMQLGSGSYDPIIGLTYAGFAQGWSWGVQQRSVFRLSDNDEDYRLGDEHQLTGWIARSWSDSISTSLRLAWRDQGHIDGIDSRIVAPVQTADPDRQGGSRTDLGLGLNWAGQAELRGHRVGVEWLLPIDQDLNGPQLEVDWQLVAGYQFSF